MIAQCVKLELQLSVLFLKYILFAQQHQIIYNISQTQQSNTMCNVKYKYSLENT